MRPWTSLQAASDYALLSPPWYFIISAIVVVIALVIAHVLTKKRLGRVPRRILFVTLLAAAVLLILLPAVIPNNLFHDTAHQPLITAVYQFLLLVPVGGAVTLLYQLFMANRRAKEEEKKVLRAMLDDIVSAYNQAKRVRRLMRARMELDAEDNGRRYVLASVYDKQMEILADAELDFESLQRRIRCHQTLFNQHFEKTLEDDIKKIKGYLSGTVSEFQLNLRHFEGDPPRKSLDELPTLERFPHRHEDQKEQDEFRRPFRKLVARLTDAINERTPESGDEDRSESSTDIEGIRKDS